MEKKKMLFYSLFISILFLIGFFAISGRSITSDMNFDFSDEELYSSVNDYNNLPFISNMTFNMRNETEWGSNYTGSYSFDGEIGETGTDLYLVDVDNSDASCSITGIGTFANRPTVAYLEDNNGAGSARIDDNFISSQTTGTMEFWIAGADVTQTFYIILEDATNTQATYMRIDTEIFEIREFGGGWTTIGAVYDNTWVHIRVEFDCVSDTSDIWFNNVYSGNYNNYQLTSSLTHVMLNTGNVQQSDFYIDAIGYSWLANYTIGDNWNPNNTTISNLLEVNRYEFSYEAPNDFYDIGADNVDGWSDIDSGDQVNVYQDLSESLLDRSVRIDVASIGTWGIEKDFTYTENIYNISFGVHYTQMDSVASWSGLSVESSDNTEIAHVRFYLVSGSTLRFGYKASGGGIVILSSACSLNKEYEANLYINYNNGFIYIILWEDDILFNTYQIPFRTYGKSGIGKIQYEGYSGAVNDLDFRIDYIGIYENGRSSSAELGRNVYGLYVSDINSNTWNMEQHNLLTIRGTGNFTLMKHYYLGSPPPIYVSTYEPEDTVLTIIGMREYDNTTEFFNVYDSGVPFSTLGDQLPIFILTSNFSFTYLQIHGVLLTEGINKYYITYDHSNIDTNESYFYVIGSVLYFTMTTDDNNLEYISCSFDIIDEDTTNSTLYWSGLKYYPSLEAEFRVNYIDTTYTPFVFRTVLQAQTGLIPQGLEIDSFQLIITDNDNDIDNTITGYLNSFSLIYTLGIQIDIVLTDYLGILAPILLITIITITIWQASKKKVKSMLIVPSIAGMSLGVFVMGMIPVWLFFSILVSCGVLIYSKWEDQFGILSSFITMIMGFLVRAAILPLWVFYLSFLIMVGYVIISGTKKLRSG
jgi:hypothetical protein